MAMIISAVAIVALTLGAVYYYGSRTEPAEEAAAPVYGTDNPLEKKPELTPTAKTNPYSGVKTNPFE